MTFPTRKNIDYEFLCIVEEVLRKAVREFHRDGHIDPETFDNIEEIADTLFEMLGEQEEE